MNLADLWFVIVAVLWTGFFVLEGFDFGVGALHSVIGRSEFERRAAINTVGPFWDANEVWLVVGAAAIFAAFPAWYATWFSAAYLPVVLLLVALIFRGIAFEWRGRGRSDRSRWLWSLGLSIGSVVAPAVLGIALGALLAGIPINSDGEFTGSVWDLFSGFALWAGLTVLLLCLFHGATFLTLRTTDDLRLRARRYGRIFAVVVFVVVAVFAFWMLQIAETGIVTYVLLGIAFAGIVVAFVGLVRGRDGLAFTASTFAVAATVASLFTSLHPDVLVSSTSSANSLTVAGSASGEYALTVMTVVVAVFLPIVLLYQGYTYVVFRRRISGTPPPSLTSPPSPTPSTAATPQEG